VRARRARYLAPHSPMKLYLMGPLCHYLIVNAKAETILSTFIGNFIMAKAVSTIQSGETLTFSGLSDLGYKQAKIGDSLIQTAKYALEKISGFPEEISPEATKCKFCTADVK
jgi:hypothetical protein